MTDEGDLNQFVNFGTQPFVPQLAQGFRPLQPSHFFFAEVNFDVALAGVHFFVGPDGVPPAAIVRLGKSPSRLHARSMASHVVRYFDDKIDGYDGEIDEIDVTQRRIILPGG
jgi:hypothetical protein